MPASSFPGPLTFPNLPGMNNTNRGFILCLVALCWGIWTAKGETVRITGRSIEYAGDSLVVYGYTNMITFGEKEMAACVAGDSGDFECSFELDETRLIFMHLGTYNCYMYAEPGLVYEIRLPRKRLKSLADEANQFYEETSVHLSVKVTGTKGGAVVPEKDQELNFLIHAFNDYFYPYYYKFAVNAYSDRIDQKELKDAMDNIQTPFEAVRSPFFSAYMEYRIGLLNHYGNQISNQRIMEEYFLHKPVLYHNPAYMELFNEIFNDFFNQFNIMYPNRNLPTILNRDKDYSRLNEILVRDAGLSHDSLRELILLKGFYEGFYDQHNIRSSMLQLLDSLRVHTGIDLHTKMVADIMLEITRLLPGYSPPDFALFDHDSTLVRLSDFSGQYIYLNFCNSFSYYCIKEYEYLKILQQRLQDRLVILTILVDDSFQSMQELVRNNAYPWTFLHFSNQPGVIDDYDIQTYPSYFLIGQEGKLILSPAPSPAENFEATFRKLLQ
jgi:peroxiredoxin